MLQKEQKEKITKEVQSHEKDTGSSEVQIALLSKQIDQLLLHLKKNPKDVHSKRGLLKMVARRRTFLGYLKDRNEKKYKSVLKKIGLKK